MGIPANIPGNTRNYYWVFTGRVSGIEVIEGIEGFARRIVLPNGTPGTSGKSRYRAMPGNRRAE
jgi:hypothetical protein